MRKNQKMREREIGAFIMSVSVLQKQLNSSNTFKRLISTSSDRLTTYIYRSRERRNLEAFGMSVSILQKQLNSSNTFKRLVSTSSDRLTTYI